MFIYSSLQPGSSLQSSWKICCDLLSKIKVERKQLSSQSALLPVPVPVHVWFWVSHFGLHFSYCHYNSKLYPKIWYQLWAFPCFKIQHFFHNFGLRAYWTWKVLVWVHQQMKTNTALHNKGKRVLLCSDTFYGLPDNKMCSHVAVLVESG